jgi:hypothetical protein
VVKNKGGRKASGDDEDFMSIWGVSGLVCGSTGKSNARERPSEHADEDTAVKAAKKQRKAAKSAASGQPWDSLASDVAAADTASQAEPDVGASSSWMFGGSTRARGPQRGKSNKEVDSTEKVLQQYEGLVRQLSEETSFLNLTFAKVTNMSEKLYQRNTEEILRACREVCGAGGPEGTRAVAVMKRLAAAIDQVGPFCQVVSALKDAETTSQTMMQSLQEARQSGLVLPGSCDKIAYARRLQELSKTMQWAPYLDALASKDLVRLFPENTEEGPAALADFQFFSLKTTLVGFLNQEIPLPAAVAKPAKGDHVSQEEKKAQELALKQAWLGLN